MPAWRSRLLHQRRVCRIEIHADEPGLACEQLQVLAQGCDETLLAQGHLDGTAHRRKRLFHTGFAGHYLDHMQAKTAMHQPR